MTLAAEGDATPPVVVYESKITRERIEILGPLTDELDEEALRTGLDLPEWVDLRDSMVRRAAAVLWAGRRLPELATQLSDVRLDDPRRPLVPKVFGGLGFRMRCPSANADPAFRREMKDIDYVIPAGQGRDFLSVLTSLHRLAGNLYFHYLRSEDRQFNALRGGKRYRIRAVVRGPDGTIGSQINDVFVGEQLSFCHAVPIAEELANADPTFSVPLLVVSKAQFIKRVPRDAIEGGSEHRVVAGLKGEDVAIGMEEKDIADVCAAFVDDASRDLPSQIARVVRAARDWGLWRTVILNLGNEAAATKVLADRGVDDGRRMAILAGMLRAVEELAREEPPRPRWRLRSIWWEEVEEG